MHDCTEQHLLVLSMTNKSLAKHHAGMLGHAGKHHQQVCPLIKTTPLYLCTFYKLCMQKVYGVFVSHHTLSCLTLEI